MDELYFKVVLITGLCGFALFAFAANSLNPFAVPGRSRLRLQHRAARWAGCILALSPLALLIKPPLSVSGGVRFSLLCAVPLLTLVAIVYMVKRLAQARDQQSTDDRGVDSSQETSDLATSSVTDTTSPITAATVLAAQAGSSETLGNEIPSPELPEHSGGLPGRAEPVLPHGPKPSVPQDTVPPVATDRKPVGINADRQRVANRVLRRKATGRNDKTAKLMVS